MTEVVFTTERLAVRRWRDSDLPVLQAVYGDADAMRWVGEGRAITDEECVQWLGVTRANYGKRGYGMFAVEEKTSACVVGFCGLVHPGGQLEPEVKYAYLRSHWGRGFATETVTGLLRYGAGVRGLHFVIATTAPAHIASQRVLLKAGMERGALRDNGDGSQTQLFHWRADRGAG
jgi:RimJ/RimL family protein N-acetyltransferase